MKKISLICLLVIFMFGCGDDSSEDVNSSIIADITPFAGTTTRQVKTGTGNNYPLIEADFDLITFMSFKNNSLLIADLSDLARYYLRNISLSDNTVNEIDNYTASSFSLGKVELSENNDLVYIYNYSDLYAFNFGSPSYQKLNDDEIETFALSPSGEIFIFYLNDDDDTYYVSKLDGSNAMKVREAALGRTQFPRLRFFIANNSDHYYKIGSVLLQGDNAFFGNASLQIDEIVLTQNNNFIFTELNSGDLYFLENGAEEPIHLTASDSPYADAFDNISALALDNDSKILYVADQSMIFTVKLNRL